MKMTEKQLKNNCSNLNLGKLKSTPYGIGIEKNLDGYKVTLTKRDNGSTGVLANELSASEAGSFLLGFVSALDINPGAKVCDDCGKEMLEAKAKLTGVTYWLCRYCGKAVEA